MPLSQVKIGSNDNCNYRLLVGNWIGDHYLLINSNCFVLRRFSKFGNYQ